MKYCKAFGQQAWAWPGHFKPDFLLYVCVHVCVWACAHGMGMNKYIVVSIYKHRALLLFQPSLGFSSSGHRNGSPRQHPGTSI